MHACFHFSNDFWAISVMAGLNVFVVLIASWSAGLKAPAARLGMKRTHRDYPVKRQGLISQARDDISSSDGKR
jgi:hypothetical protein